MTPDEAADLAARILAAVPESSVWLTEDEDARYAADRERVASDSGLYRASYKASCVVGAVARTAALDNLRRTARLYGVTE